MRILPETKQRFSEIEFWALTSVFCISILFFTWGGLGDPSTSAGNDPEALFGAAGVKFGYYKHYFIPYIIRYITYFIFFMFFNFRLLPRLTEEGPKKSIIALLGLGLVIIFLVNLSTDFYLRAYLWRSLDSDDRAVEYIAQSDLIYTLWLAFAFVTYGLFKYGGLLILSHFEEHPPKMALLQQKQLWMLLLTILIGLMLSFFVKTEVFLMWITIIPLSILFYNFCIYRLIPFALSKKRPKLTYSAGIILAAFISWVIIALGVMAPTNNNEASLISAFATAFSMVLVGAPSLWYWYHYQQKRKANVQVLQQKLGQSTAQLDQLRAQINPHFLFNALNTVYGLALTEKAEQSAEAIEKISEMMRFMLRENQEDMISLEKDLDYLKNYMGIQQMRLGSNPNIELSTEIPEVISPTLTIAPMLLIPFVENAFKHGISLQSHSYIRLAIQLEGNKLVFSLQNSTHDRIWLDDPEKNNHGIGMNNVKQRLALLYPDRHLLSVKEDDHSFNVDLTVLL